MNKFNILAFRSAILAVVHILLLGSLAGVIGSFAIGFRDGMVESDILMLLSVSSGTFFILIASFRAMTCSRSDVIKMLQQCGVKDIRKNKKIGKDARGIVGNIGDYYVRVRASRPYADFWPYYMPPIGADGLASPTGIQFLNVTNKCRDGGISVYSRTCDLEEEGRGQVGMGNLVATAEFGSWMSRKMVLSIISDVLKELR